MEEAIAFTNIGDLIPTTFAQDSADFGVGKDLIFHEHLLELLTFLIGVDLVNGDHTLHIPEHSFLAASTSGDMPVSKAVAR